MYHLNEKHHDRFPPHRAEILPEHTLESIQPLPQGFSQAYIQPTMTQQILVPSTGISPDYPQQKYGERTEKPKVKRNSSSGSPHFSEVQIYKLLDSLEYHGKIENNYWALAISFFNTYAFFENQPQLHLPPVRQKFWIFHEPRVSFFTFYR